ncbi:MAG: hypothetical protein QM661_01970 [Solimonas sp.]
MRQYNGGGTQTPAGGSAWVIDENAVEAGLDDDALVLFERITHTDARSLGSDEQAAPGIGSVSPRNAARRLRDGGGAGQRAGRSGRRRLYRRIVGAANRRHDSALYGRDGGLR